jgi:hypothetical protein
LGTKNPLSASVVSTPWPDLPITGTNNAKCASTSCAPTLRMPYETDPASEKYREGEREVRLTIIRIVRDHLQDPSAPTTWVWS